MPPARPRAVGEVVPVFSEFVESGEDPSTGKAKDALMSPRRMLALLRAFYEAKVGGAVGSSLLAPLLGRRRGAARRTEMRPP